MHPRLKQAQSFVRTGLSKTGLDRSYFKVFAIGFNKTATSSIAAVLSQCGLSTVHSVWWRRTASPLAHWSFDAFSDGPPDHFEVLDRRYPRSKFILNVRDLNEWIDSRIEHYKDGIRTEGWVSWKAHDDDAVKAWIAKRNAHHLRVLHYFSTRPNDLLVINYIRDPQAARMISSFVGRFRDFERPYIQSVATNRQAGQLLNAEQIRRCFGELGIPRASGPTTSTVRVYRKRWSRCRLTPTACWESLSE
jgi:hypothetical protein